ncbi:MAG: ABC transporter ATP-binding protein [Acidimicrobiia bacterium]
MARGPASEEKQRRREGWRFIIRLLLTRKGWLAVSVGAGLLWTAARVVIPLLTAAAVDQGIIAGDTATALAYAGAILAVGLLQMVFTGARRYGAFWLAYRTETDLRATLFAHFQRLHFAFHDEAQTGELMARANTDLLQINQAIAMLPFSLAAVTTLVVVAIVMFVQSWSLTLLALGALPLLNIVATRFSTRVGPISVQLQDRLGDLSTVVEESVAGIRAVKGFGAEQEEIERLDVATDNVLDRALETAKLRAGFLPLVDFIPSLALLAVLWYGGHLVIDGKLEVGQLIAYNLFIMMLIMPMRVVGQLVAQAARAVASASRIDDALHADPEIVDPHRPVELPAGGNGEVRFEHVTFGYGDGPLVLDDLDLVLRGGEAVAVVGATASGKTTIARLIPRLYDVHAGRVVIDGVDVRELRLTDLRRGVGIVFEETFLFTGSVRHNIAFAVPDASMEQVRRAARLAGAEEFIDGLPDGFGTEIGEHGFSLSGGQRQRVAIARAVIAEPRVLILDDATSSVDPTKEYEIRAALREVMEGRTTLIIAHRPATIALADRVVLLDGGRIVADGTHTDLLATNERYREVLASAAHARVVPTLVPVAEDGPP